MKPDDMTGLAKLLSASLELKRQEDEQRRSQAPRPLRLRCGLVVAQARGIYLTRKGPRPSRGTK